MKVYFVWVHLTDRDTGARLAVNAIVSRPSELDAGSAVVGFFAGRGFTIELEETWEVKDRLMG